MAQISAPAPFSKPRNWSDRTMRFGIFWPGTRTLLPSQEIASLNPDPLDLSIQMELAMACEEVGLDLTLIGDGYAPSSEEGTKMGFQDPGLHALTLAGPLLMATQHLGVISTLHTTFFHPAHIARFAANLDWLSGGRWGWNIVNGYRDYEASLFGFSGLPDSASMYDAADEAVRIIASLWDSSKRTEFEGVHYQSHGKMKGPYPPAKPLYVCAGASERGRQFTAAHCEYLFASPREFSMLPVIKADLVREAEAIGRPNAPEVLVVADLMIRDEPGEAEALFDELMGSIETNEAGQKWSSQIGKLRAEKTAPFKFPHFVGTAEEVAAQLLAAHRDHELNGVLFRLPVWSPGEVRRLAPVFEILDAEGVRIPPASRGYSW
jgi:dimethylsulfone monooxygenase